MGGQRGLWAMVAARCPGRTFLWLLLHLLGLSSVRERVKTDETGWEHLVLEIWEDVRGWRENSLKCDNEAATQMMRRNQPKGMEAF